MAKRDEFGRPIYETAEEYNKAHKTSGYTQAYTSSDGDTYESKSVNQKIRQFTTTKNVSPASKSTKNASIAIVGFFVLVNFIIIGFVMGSVSGSFGSGGYEEEVYEEHWYPFGEYYENNETPLPLGYDIIYYNDVTCGLPTTFDEVVQLGFELEGYDEDVLFPKNWEEFVDFYSEDGLLLVSVRVINDTDDEKRMGECLVDCFEIENTSVFGNWEEVPIFTFADGLTFASDYYEVENYFGIPHYSHKTSHLYDEGVMLDGMLYEEYGWAYYSEEEIQYVKISFLDGMMWRVSLEKKAYEEKL